MADKIYTISEINNRIKSILDANDDLAGVYVKGEISNYKLYPSGHHYFSLKDAESALKCVMFKGNAKTLRFKPENGMSVVASGRISVYPRDGQYQLYVAEITPHGVGDLFIAFEQLKDKLFKEGLFDAHHKKPLPRYPKEIAVVTSGSGAAVEDIKRILCNRWPVAEVVIVPVRVQGAEAPPEIAEAIGFVNELGTADIIITGRGGGSIEDLWAFNDETVARAIFASKIPVISAVGHEPDVTIADFVADVRAATPSNAAEIAVPDIAEVRTYLQSSAYILQRSVINLLKTHRQRLKDISGKRVLQSHGAYIDDRRIQTDMLMQRLFSAMRCKLSGSREKYVRLSSSLDALSPLRVLGRGYAIARRDDGTVVKTASDVKKGDLLSVRLQKDEIACTVI